MRVTVSGSASTASSVNALVVSSSFCSGSAVLEKAAPSSSTTVRSESRGTDRTKSSRLTISCSTGTGVLVRPTGMTEPPSRYGPPSLAGRRSTYCSPIAERLWTAASTSMGMAGAVRRMSSCASTPSVVTVSSPTRPTLTPRYVTSAPVKIPPDCASWTRTG
jgi:hypothetical protein